MDGWGSIQKVVSGSGPAQERPEHRSKAEGGAAVGLCGGYLMRSCLGQARFLGQ
jgi:hypothetical protein